MCAQESSTPDYTMGFSEEFIRILRRYTAETHAAHLLPYLRPGLRVLDFGCGPGTISVGLAQAIQPGELHGVDMEESQIDMARAVATSNGRANAKFHVGDVTSLEFEDNFFDLAHCHNVLMHVPDTQAVLAEVKRVLKPGGIIGCREMITASSFTHPDFGVIRRAWTMFEDLLEADDAHLRMGTDLKIHFLDARFDNVRVTASFDIYHTLEDIEFISRIADQWFLSPEITEAAIKYGASTERLVKDIREAYEKWKVHPGAFAAIAYGEAIANKPFS